MLQAENTKLLQTTPDALWPRSTQTAAAAIHRALTPTRAVRKPISLDPTPSGCVDVPLVRI